MNDQGEIFGEYVASRLAEFADLLTSGQRELVRSLYIDQHATPRLVDPPARTHPPTPVIQGRAVDKFIVDEISQIFASTTWEPAPEVTLADVVRAAHELEGLPKLPEKIKLTSGEWETVKAHVPRAPDWGPDRSAAWVWGVPVELVDDPEESDLRRWYR